MQKCGRERKQVKTVNDTYMSFYLRANRVHIFVDALWKIGQPKYICFMIEENGKTLVMAPYPKKDFYSHRVPPGVYNGSKSMEVCSLRLCRILADLYAWDLDASYRVPGTIIQRKNIAMFYLDEAEVIEHDEMFMYKE